MHKKHVPYLTKVYTRVSMYMIKLRYETLGVTYHEIRVRKSTSGNCYRRFSWRCKIRETLHKLQELELSMSTGGAKYFFICDLGDVYLNRLPIDDDVIASVVDAYGTDFGMIRACYCE